MARKKSPSPLLTTVLTYAIASYIRLVYRTVRWTVVGERHHLDLIEREEPFICAAWHARMLMMPMIQRVQKKQMVVMVSDHRDGTLIARVLERFDFGLLRGSAADPRKPQKSKGGAGALKGLCTAMAGGANAGITPDGPRGPAQVAHPGIAQLARLTGADVLPISYSVHRGVRLKSWDRFLIPLPFSRGVVVFGAPLKVEGRGADAIEAGRGRIEAALNAVTTDSDTKAGRPPEALPNPVQGRQAGVVASRRMEATNA